jgi:hypothetical protein
MQNALNDKSAVLKNPPPPKGKKPKWRNSEAKKLLQKDLEEGRVTAQMAPDEVYAMKDEYKEFDYTNFKRNLLNLRNKAVKQNKDCSVALTKSAVVLKNPPTVSTTAYPADATAAAGIPRCFVTTTKKKKKGKKPKWETSEAKKLLQKDLEEGRVTAQMAPDEVYAMKDEYREFKYENFRNNLLTLKKKAEQNGDSAAFDSAALANDEKIYPRPATAAAGYPRWDRSDAERLLKVDVDKGKHAQMTPQKLRACETAYEEFPLEVFRKHIYQETRSRKDTAYWMDRREKSKKN